jgi:signal peptidase II
MRAVPRSRYLIFFAIALLGLAADLTTKKCVFDRLGPPGGNTLWVWQGVFGFETSLNPGALFGIGSDWPAMRYVTCGLSMLAVVAVLTWLFGYDAAKSLLLTIALGCVTAGVLGNLCDRLGLPGLVLANGATVHEVRDWILFIIPVLHRPWPNFNIADSLLVCGAGLVVWHALLGDVRKPTEGTTDKGLGIGDEGLGTRDEG